jgi:hypothetical protein
MGMVPKQWSNSQVYLVECKTCIPQQQQFRILRYMLEMSENEKVFAWF